MGFYHDHDCAAVSPHNQNCEKIVGHNKFTGTKGVNSFLWRAPNCGRNCLSGSGIKEYVLKREHRPINMKHQFVCLVYCVLFTFLSMAIYNSTKIKIYPSMLHTSDTTMHCGII